ncbi:septum formation initiator family protein [Streptomyces violaceusniger]|uniref:Cell division protein FtsB n=2 Tax=Streptomyces violaceusniger group TaxID=2839105 RepID=A0A1H4PB70_STRMJ|nr:MULTISPECIES: septum formation initiator family protein [Streptomyces]AEM87809.1 Septum formation initiator [Streptomyces violaceusniger Tu 4113]AQW51337.1 septum formation initiator [Streptomyces hygroscopicus]ASQ95146.1 acyl-phosphate glycerol 3-phosphate acyltransferase [Streptomyces sp. 11-1-2]MBO3680359.1 septum formation initiator family protein [Streptomyces sp. NEAU-YJ-81]SEC04683.1 Cell division protein FtsB [Streptomyces melanosporofaciens]
MPADRERFSTATRLKALGEHAAARVYRVRTKRRRGRLTGRAALLALVVCSLVVALAYPMRQYISQRSDIAEQRSEAQRAREDVKKLRERKARLRDPAYTEQQARERLHFLMPGETGYSVVDGSGSTERSTDQGAAGRPWYSNLWDAVDTADAAGAGSARR